MPQTHHMLDLPALQCLKPNCHLINYARGELIESEALACVPSCAFHPRASCD